MRGGERTACNTALSSRRRRNVCARRRLRSGVCRHASKLWRVACTLTRMRIKGRTLAMIESARGALSELVQLSAGMSGLFLTGLTRLRVVVSAACVLTWLALAAAGFHPTFELA